MSHESISFNACVLGFFFVAACGSEVVIDDGSGGDTSASGTAVQGSTGGPSSGSGSANGSTSAGGEGTAALDAACDALCMVAPQCTSAGEPCEQFCLEGAPTGCEKQTADLTNCEAPYLDAMCVPDTSKCAAERAAFEACAATAPPTHCSSVSFSQVGASCEGDGFCVNGKSAKIACTTTPSGIHCECFVGGQSLGQCSANDASCILQGSCCEAFY